MSSYFRIPKKHNAALHSVIYGRQIASRHTNATSPLLFAGGLIWIIYYLLQIIFGIYGVHALSLEVSFLFVEELVFSAALVCICTALIRLSYRLHQQSAGWAYAGMIFAGIALAGTMAGILVNVLAGGHVGILGATGVIGSCISATLTATGALRSKSLPHKQAVFLLLIGAFTFPLVLAFSIPLHIPVYFTEELPFAISGFAWVVFSILHKEK